MSGGTSFVIFRGRRAFYAVFQELNLFFTANRKRAVIKTPGRDLTATLVIIVTVTSGGRRL